MTIRARLAASLGFDPGISPRLFSPAYPAALELSVVEQLARYFRTKHRLEVVIAGLD
jgi:hypothetical protein